MHQAMDKNGISAWTKDALALVYAGAYPAARCSLAPSVNPISPPLAPRVTQA